ncbi:NAD-dependent DNA ligase LigA [Pseudomonas saudiphocaensis]|uniref:NAD-dependent DNA ligase LigA n=1 Tax=Pseudomonas saudiphocaensis TaxID=1499686 RepID=A0A078LRZ4_9PSED|nr:NAD-dependent DNA ligase LigA [Pseudomonas saudiphocaensis]
MLGNALVHFVSRRALRIPNVGEETAKLLARALGSLECIGQALPDVLVYLPEVGLEVAHETHSFFEDEHNRTVIAQLRERGSSCRRRASCIPEFAACATLAGLIDKLKIPFIAPSQNAWRIASAAWKPSSPPTGLTSVRSSALPKKALAPCAITSTARKLPAPARSKRNCANSACIGKAHLEATVAGSGAGSKLIKANMLWG